MKNSVGDFLHLANCLPQESFVLDASRDCCHLPTSGFLATLLEWQRLWERPGATSNDQWKSSCGSDGKCKIYYGSGEWKSCDSDGNDQSKSYCGSGTWESSYGRDDKCQSYGSDGNDQWKGYYGKWESYGNDQWKSYYGNDHQWKSY